MTSIFDKIAELISPEEKKPTEVKVEPIKPVNAVAQKVPNENDDVERIVEAVESLNPSAMKALDQVVANLHPLMSNDSQESRESKRGGSGLTK